MKRILNLLFVSITLSLFVASCACSGVDCQNGGTCNDGTCDCLRGYYGDNCELKDFCEINEVICVYGECEEGICFCEDGYELEDCSIASRDKFLGAYRVLSEGVIDVDTFTGYNMGIQVSIDNPARMELINVFNFSNWDNLGFFSKIIATPTPNTNKFRIQNQEPDGNGKSIQGDGTISILDSVTTRINIDYTVRTKNNKEYVGELEAELIIP